MLIVMLQIVYSVRLMTNSSASNSIGIPSQVSDLLSGKSSIVSYHVRCSLYYHNGGSWQEEYTEEDLLCIRRLIRGAVEAAEVDWD